MTDGNTRTHQVQLLYGREGMKIDLPPGARPTVIAKRPLPRHDDPQAAIERALAEPVGAPAFDELVRGRKSACILICDVTRPVPNHLFLRPLIERMLTAGIPRERITVLVATGLHRPNLGEELAEVVGDPWVLSTVRVENPTTRATPRRTSISASRRAAARR